MNCHYTTSSNILDLCLTDTPNKLISVRLAPNPIKGSISFSDHFPICVRMNTASSSPIPQKHKIHNFKKMDNDGLSLAIHESPFQPYCWTNLSLMMELRHNWLDPLLAKFVPCKTQLPPWITPPTSNLLKRFRIIETHLKLTTNYTSKLSSLRLAVSLKCDEDLASYQINIADYRDTKKNFQHLRRIRSGSRIPATVTNGSLKANSPLEQSQLFNSYFKSVFNPCCNCTNFRYTFEYTQEGDFDTSLTKITLILS